MARRGDDEANDDGEHVLCRPMMLVKPLVTEEEARKRAASLKDAIVDSCRMWTHATTKRRFSVCESVYSAM